jgi:hypoxanthine phosphoribosyltransferase
MGLAELLSRNYGEAGEAAYGPCTRVSQVFLSPSFFFSLNSEIPNDHTPVVTLEELPGLVARLAEKIRQSGFSPDVIVFVESGARLPAVQLCSELRCGAVPVGAQRLGTGIKRLLAPLAHWLPRSLLNGMRRCEERSGLHGRTGRKVDFPVDYNFCGKAVLLLDDAADSGRTLVAVKQALILRGADADRLRCAVLAATTPPGRAEVDFYLSELNSVLPWSTDSAERRVAQLLMAKAQIPSP